MQKTNTGNVRESNITQETHVVEKGCTNMDTDSKIKHSVNGQNGKDNVNKAINYFLYSANIEGKKEH